MRYIIYKLFVLAALSALASGCVRVHQADRETLSKQISNSSPWAAAKLSLTISTRYGKAHPAARARAREAAAAAVKRLLFTAARVVCLERAAHSKTSLEFVVRSMSHNINSQIDLNTSFFGSVVFDALSSASAKAFDSATGASPAGPLKQRAPI